MYAVKFLALFLLSLIPFRSSAFTYNGFKHRDLELHDAAQITDNGLLSLSNSTKLRQNAHAFYPTPFIFKNSGNDSVFSFSTYFVFAMVPQLAILPGPGIAFVISPKIMRLGSPFPNFLGMFDESNDGNPSNHVLAVEIDMLQDPQADDMDGHHIGIDVNGVKSKVARTASYYDSRVGSFQDVNLASGLPFQIWIEYDGESTLLNVTLAPSHVEKPSIPLLSFRLDLSPVLNQSMFVGFSGGSFITAQYVLGWSFAINGKADLLDTSHLPKLPRVGPKKYSRFLTIGVPSISILFLLITIFGLGYYIRRQLKFSELVEDWELDYIPQRYTYKNLYFATNGFKDGELLGKGGFGKVYRGVLGNPKTQIAVKKISHESRQGMKEFIAEIASMGRLRHRNLVALLGYCRRKTELLLVYEFMPNGSLDKYLHDNPKSTLNWDQRFRIVKGVASGLLYLHEEWEQVVIHRDIKASNILLDEDFNARLGDFGLARLYDHGTDPQTTHVVGTLGYLAPEHTRTGKATTATDVYGFGAFLLEVACGRRPVEPRSSEPAILIDWVLCLWGKGQIIEAVDQKLGGDYTKEEVQLVLELGLLCVHSRPEMRPTMRQVVMYLTGDAVLPELSSLGVCATDLVFAYGEGFEDFGNSNPFTSHGTYTGPFSNSSSVLHSGR